MLGGVRRQVFGRAVRIQKSGRRTAAAGVSPQQAGDQSIALFAALGLLTGILGLDALSETLDEKYWQESRFSVLDDSSQESLLVKEVQTGDLVFFRRERFSPFKVSRGIATALQQKAAQRDVDWKRAYDAVGIVVRLPEQENWPYLLECTHGGVRCRPLDERLVRSTSAGLGLRRLMLLEPPSGEQINERSMAMLTERQRAAVRKGGVSERAQVPSFPGLTNECEERLIQLAEFVARHCDDRGRFSLPGVSQDDDLSAEEKELTELVGTFAEGASLKETLKQYLSPLPHEKRSVYLLHKLNERENSLFRQYLPNGELRNFLLNRGVSTERHDDAQIVWRALEEANSPSPTYAERNSVRRLRMSARHMTEMDQDGDEQETVVDAPISSAAAFVTRALQYAGIFEAQLLSPNRVAVHELAHSPSLPTQGLHALTEGTKQLRHLESPVDIISDFLGRAFSLEIAASIDDDDSDAEFQQLFDAAGDKAE
ncbi:MAG: hypothetical protein MHM6MM_002912 [Cercozoa sp. M6MM]